MPAVPPPSNTAPSDPGFSAMLLAGLLIQPLPRAPLNRALRYFARRIQQNHPGILMRLEPLAGAVFLIRPTDLPHAIRLEIGAGHVDCSLSDDFDGPADVTVSGAFLSLLDMMDGKVDGDALFFSRSLAVEGDTEALLTLRNALDSDDIDIRAEILQSLGLLKGPATGLLGVGGRLFHRLSRDMNVVSQALTRPLSHRCDALEQENRGLRGKVAHLEQMLTKTQNRVQSLTRRSKI